MKLITIAMFLAVLLVSGLSIPEESPGREDLRVVKKEADKGCAS